MCVVAPRTMLGYEVVQFCPVLLSVSVTHKRWWLSGDARWGGRIPFSCAILAAGMGHLVGPNVPHMYAFDTRYH